MLYENAMSEESMFLPEVNRDAFPPSRLGHLDRDPICRPGVSLNGFQQDHTSLTPGTKL